MMKFTRWPLIALLAMGLAPLSDAAEQKPKWEVGMGVAYIDFPDYRGSNERQSYLLPTPFLVYRGDILQVSRDHAHGRIFKSDKVELDVSVNGSVPAKSADNIARRGMPDLDATLELGPSLNIHLLKTDEEKTIVDVRLPLRPVWASNLSYMHQMGWLFQPQLDVDFKDAGGYPGWNLGLVVGPIFADRRYHQYFYNVAPAYATATRPAYSAHGGYSGSQAIIALSKRFPKYYVTGFAKFDSLKGAAFEDSPLIKSKQYFTTGFALWWTFDESETMVEDGE